jgi:hypothetical protein
VENAGDLPVSFAASFYLMSGEIEMPTLRLGQEAITANVTLHPCDLIEFSTLPSKKFVRVNGQDVPFLRTSRFFSLPRGRSILEMSEGDLVGIVTLFPRYLGA